MFDPRWNYYAFKPLMSAVLKVSKGAVAGIPFNCVAIPISYQSSDLISTPMRYKGIPSLAQSMKSSNITSCY